MIPDEDGHEGMEALKNCMLSKLVASNQGFIQDFTEGGGGCKVYSSEGSTTTYIFVWDFEITWFQNGFPDSDIISRFPIDFHMI